MSEQLYSFIADQRCGIEDALRARLPLSSLPGARRFNDALEYAVFPGGKRMRPVLALLASDLAGVPREHGLTIACAVEFLHSSSLILDDLPGMDDADLRRNRRALHLVFGEGIAMLASIALLNQSYSLLAQAAHVCGRAGAIETLMCEAARCIGAEGMIGGQVVDLEVRAGATDLNTLASRDLKTVALMRLLMTAGALACDADERDAHALAEFGDCFGRAYQICDDLLDDAGEGCLTGKTAGQDARHVRANAVSAMGARGARRMAAQLIERGSARLIEQFGERPEVLLFTEAARFILDRVKDVMPSYDSHLAATVSHAAGRFD